MSQVKKENPMGYAPINKILWQFAIPATVAIVVQFLYNIVDQIFIGQGVGYLGNAATTVALPLMTMVTFFTTFIGAGGSAFAAIKMGAKEHEVAEVALNNTFVMALSAGIIYAVLGLTFLEPILRFFGATDSVLPYAKDYAGILLAAAPIAVVGPSISNFVRADGQPRLAMYSVMTGAVLNCFLDPLYIFVFKWGVKGAAIATVTAQCISVIVNCGWFLTRGSIRLKPSKMKLVPDICKQILTLGSSSAVNQIVNITMQIILNNSLAFYGAMSAIGADIALSSMGITMKISMLLTSLCLGIGVGAQAIFGFNYGAKKYDRVKKLYKTAVSSAVMSLVVGWAICQIFPTQIVALFGGGSEEFRSFAVMCIRVYLGAIFCAGIQMVSVNYFQATGQPLKATILSLLRQVILMLPLLLIIPKFFGVYGVLYAGPITDALAAVIVCFLIIPEMRRLDKLIKEMPEPSPL